MLWLTFCIDVEIQPKHAWGVFSWGSDDEHDGGFMCLLAQYYFPHGTERAGQVERGPCRLQHSKKQASPEQIAESHTRDGMVISTNTHWRGRPVGNWEAKKEFGGHAAGIRPWGDSSGGAIRYRAHPLGGRNFYFQAVLIGFGTRCRVSVPWPSTACHVAPMATGKISSCLVRRRILDPGLAAAIPVAPLLDGG